MAKSFCSNCKHWILYRNKPYGGNYDASNRFHYCEVLETASLRERKLLCHGNFKIEKEI